MPEDAPNPDRPPRPWRLTAALALAALAAALCFRVLGPSDLNANQDQSKTIAFTLDIVLNGNWALPSDGMGHLSRKPPFVNWLAVPPVAAGWTSELALKSPAILSGVVTMGATIAGAGLLFRRLDRPGADPGDVALAHHAPAAAVAAGAVWLACPSSVKHIYFMRPDILLAACMTIGWIAATALVTGPTPRRPRLLAAVFWTSTGLAALAKGPMALILPAYLLLAGTLITDHPSKVTWSARLKRTARAGWWWGIPLMLAIPGAWLYGAWVRHPMHVEDVLLGSAVKGRIADDGFAAGWSKKLYALTRGVPGLLFERYMVWTVPALIALLTRPSRAIRSHPTAPASVWLLIVLLVNVLTAGRAGSYLMPAYPAASCLAVYALARIIAGATATRMPAAPALITAAALALTVGIGLREATSSRAARFGDGDIITAFARDAARRVAHDPVAFVNVNDIPVAPLMRRHHAGDATPEQIADAAWVVVYADVPESLAAWPAELESEPVLFSVEILQPRPNVPENRHPLRLLRRPAG